jgi:hypothetical protein
MGASKPQLDMLPIRRAAVAERTERVEAMIVLKPITDLWYAQTSAGQIVAHGIDLISVLKQASDNGFSDSIITFGEPLFLRGRSHEE